MSVPARQRSPATTNGKAATTTADALARGQAEAQRALLVRWLQAADVSDRDVQRRIAGAMRAAKMQADYQTRDLAIVAFVKAIEDAAKAKTSRGLSDRDAVLHAMNGFGGGSRFVPESSKISAEHYRACIAVAGRQGGRPRGKKTDGANDEVVRPEKTKRATYAEALAAGGIFGVTEKVIRAAIAKLRPTEGRVS